MASEKYSHSDRAYVRHNTESVVIGLYGQKHPGSCSKFTRRHHAYVITGHAPQRRVKHSKNKILVLHSNMQNMRGLQVPNSEFQILKAKQILDWPLPAPKFTLQAQETISTSELSESEDKQICSSRGLSRSRPLTQGSRLCQTWSEERTTKRSSLVWTTAEPHQRESAHAPSRSVAGIWKPSCPKVHMSGGDI